MGASRAVGWTLADGFGRGRSNQWDLIRLALALLVLVSHSWALSGMPEEPLGPWTRGTKDIGDLAVDAFFFASGLMLVQAWARTPHLGTFVRNRALRIAPGYLLAAAFGLLLAPVAAGSAAAVPWDKTLLAALTAGAAAPMEDPAFWRGNPVASITNGSVWTLLFEVKCYCLVALLGALGLLAGGRSRRARWALLAAVCAGVWSQWAMPNLGLRMLGNYWPIVGDVGHVARLGTWFGLGMCATLFADRLPLRKGLGAAAAVLFALVLVIDEFFWLAEAALPLLLCYVLLCLAYAPTAPAALRDFASRAAGDYSYGCYLYHWPVLQFLAGVFGVRDPWLMVALALPVTLLLARLSWISVERRALARKGRAIEDGAVTFKLLGVSTTPTDE